MKVLNFLLSLFLITLLFAVESHGREEKKISRDLLIQDMRQLVDILEHVHPDPYINGGGKIAFHRRFQELLAAIPGYGLSADELFWQLAPFLAALGDAHTFLSPPETDAEERVGIPMVFGCIDKTLYVRQVYDKSHGSHLGSRLISVAGVPFEELLARYRSLKGTRNEYNLIDNLRIMLWTGGALARLLPEWEDRDRIALALQDSDGQMQQVELEIPKERGSTVYVAGSKIQRPSRQGCEFAYDFMDKQKQTALLVVTNMANYREVLERRDTLGLSPEKSEERARRTYRRYHGTEPPDDYLVVREGVPSATEAFVSLFEEMKAADTRLLIVDLRDNSGGSSAMSAILMYFLHGRDTYLSLGASGYEVKKYSHYYFETHEKVTLEGLNEDRAVPLTVNDYAFTEALQPVRSLNAAQKREDRERKFMEQVESMPTFRKIYDQKKYDAFYCPETVVVLCNVGTFSAAFTMLDDLHKAGAVLVGTPSGQAGHCFGAAMHFTLDHSGLKGIVSQKYFGNRSRDPESSRVLMPDHVLTYEKFVSYRFDKNAEILYALELFGQD